MALLIMLATQAFSHHELANSNIETGHTWHHETNMLFDYTKLGGQAMLEAVEAKDFSSEMPGFEKVLTDEQIWEILTFIRST